MDRKRLEDDRLAMIAACTLLGRDADHPLHGRSVTLTEWNGIAAWLRARNLRPAVLLDPETIEALEYDPSANPVAVAKIANLDAIAIAASVELELLRNQGIWVLARVEGAYPRRWKRQLGTSFAPPVVFGAGPAALMNDASIAIVGSRDIAGPLVGIANSLGAAVSQGRYVVVSGGARGTDRIGMTGALECGGTAVGILSGELARLSREEENRRLLYDERLCLISHVEPAIGFSVAQAMTRNRYIHGFAEATFVISASAGKGGTWAGSVDNLKHGWSPLLVWNGPGAPDGNRALIARGGYPFDEVPADSEALAALVAEAEGWRIQSDGTKVSPAQPGLL